MQSVKIFGVLVVVGVIAVQVVNSQLPVSCGAKCGMKNVGGCSCDKDCEKSKQGCCDDYHYFCGTSCEFRCTQGFHPAFTCQCHTGCDVNHRDKNCCEDYVAMCKNPKSRAINMINPGGIRQLSFVSFTEPTDPPTPKVLPISKITGEYVDCPAGIDFFPCFTDPCIDIICPLHHDAVCVPNECGTCSSHFEDSQGKILDCSKKGITCADGQRYYDCGFKSLCSGVTCEAHPEAKCVEDKCGGCFYNFHDENGDVVDCSAPVERPSRCPHGVRPNICIPRPCSVARCPAHPHARCVNKVCGECSSEFVDEKGNLVDCEISSPGPKNCPSGKSVCESGICESGNMCPGKPSAICSVDPCGDCIPRYYDENTGDLLTEYDCAVQDACSRSRDNCQNEPCSTKRCPAHRDARCINSYCGICSAKFYDRKTGKRLRSVDCAVEEENLCSDNSRPKSCRRACRLAKCDAMPTATCYAEPCNNCRVTFYHDGKIVDCVRESSPKPVLTPNRPRTPPTVSPTSCHEKCGRKDTSNQACSCDYKCLTNNNCCEDFKPLCADLTCEGRCGKYTPHANCQCDSDCNMRGNCCSDFSNKCLTNESCKGYCDITYRHNSPCQCHQYCHITKDCCPGRDEDCSQN